MKPQRDGQKKRKQTPTGTDEPESKMNKTEGEETEGTQGTSKSVFGSVCFELVCER